MRSGSRFRAGRAALMALALLVTVLVLAQLLLPGIAADRISSKLGRHGSVGSVSVSAWPALELLWGDAEVVRVHARSLDLSPRETVDMLSEAAGAARVDVRVDEAREGGVGLADVMLQKRGSRLQAEATVTAHDIAEALPPGVRVVLLASERGTVKVRVGGGLFGVAGGLDAVAQASGGRLVVQPLSASLASLTLTLFADSRIDIEALGVRQLDNTPSAYRISLSGRLR